MVNQNAEQIARDKIDEMLKLAGWTVQDKTKINLNDGIGQAIREYQTDVGPADYVLFVDKKAVGVIEAKREEAGEKITAVEDQTEGYANAKLKWVNNSEPLPFLYESTGVITRFTDGRDPKPRSREVFSFHRPETLKAWVEQGNSLRARLQDIPPLNPAKLPAKDLGLRDCQETAITNLEDSLQKARPRALIQMATGAGKTYTAITSMYRILKHAKGKRILFLVDTKNLGEQAEQEMLNFTPSDDTRKFTELHVVQRLKSKFVPKDAEVCISTIQRMYSILKDEELDETLEEQNPAEQLTKPKEPVPVVYNPKVPIEHFDFIFIDECHRSIYNLWQQVLDYFDAFLIGLTATPDNRTYGFFKQNIVSDYSHEKAVADGVNVGNEVFTIQTRITKEGETLQAKQQVEHRERVTRKKRWEQQDEDEKYSAKQLDKDIVNPSQIRTVIKTFKESLPIIFPDREHVPKTLIFAKTDSHADDIIQTVREEFDEGNSFCKKITYRVKKDKTDKEGNVIEQGEDPKSVLSSFRNLYEPRIAVTVDMIATGTDIKPLECLVFMRDVKSRNYFEQMKGRGTRTFDHDELIKVTPDAKSAKTHYVIVDAIGVTKSLKTASQPLITKPSVPLKDLAMGIMMGASDTDSVSSLAGRLARLNKQLDANDKKRIEKVSGGVSITQMVVDLFSAIDGDKVEEQALILAKQPKGTDPGEDNRNKAQAEMVSKAANVFNGELIELIDTIRRDKDQKIDHDNIDEVQIADWEKATTEQASDICKDFVEYLEQNKDEITALEIFYDQPHRRREITFDMVKEVLEKLKSDKPKLAPLNVWQAYELLEDPDNKKEQGNKPINELTALVALIRRVVGIDDKLSTFDATVSKNFQTWIMKHHSGSNQKFTKEQMAWLHMIRDHFVNSFHFELDDLEMSPFDAQGGLGKMYQLFGDDMNKIIEELNSELVA
ncbi:type I restriction-modification enzyme R subunit C-terminal domain-containing protein [Pseudoalteromonas marina]|uniref:Type I restriction-modification enzyme R subunit C-terminal domain-containing protein n=1 Tax=Pseudoalteromonas marina TaxID=267375 RepID=A0ABT9FE41_9GAMM|nr:DEAD/DEAH box helicase family protein [Pseudoalteromonas marina]MDP2564974.1 type I restriction-modification enzyme R subunit C-terminal domain-containing protein [Pseudoalteromonas marina]